MNYKEELEMAYETLKAILHSNINLYSKDPDLYDKVQMAVETIEFSLYSKDQQEWYSFSLSTVFFSLSSSYTVFLEVPWLYRNWQYKSFFLRIISLHVARVGRNNPHFFSLGVPPGTPNQYWEELARTKFHDASWPLMLAASLGTVKHFV